MFEITSNSDDIKAARPRCLKHHHILFYETNISTLVISQNALPHFDLVLDWLPFRHRRFPETSISRQYHFGSFIKDVSAGPFTQV